jgi:hypothetical protein
MDEKPKFNIERYAVFIPLVYLIVTATIAMIGYKLELPDTLLGIIVTAGLLRVKIPVKPKV